MKKTDIQIYVEGIVNDLETATNDTLIEYFNESLDVRIEANINREYLGCMVAITLGGPNVYLNSHGKIKGSWGIEKYETYVSDTVKEALFDWGYELWEM